MTSEFKLALEIIAILIGLPATGWVFARTLNKGVSISLEAFSKCIADPISEALKENTKQEARFHNIESDIRDLKKDGQAVSDQLNKLDAKIDGLKDILLNKH